MSRACVDGNEAVASVAYRLSEVIPIFPITPASPMSEAADTWAAADRPNLFGVVPEVVEFQSEAGAAGAVHGAATKGALATTFTASQGLLLMLPDMFKLAGELLPAVIHVAARAVATHALSIFGDHSDVMAMRPSGFAMLSSSSVQEAHDLALVAHAVALSSRVPFLHFMDGFRTSHELATIDLLSDDDLEAIIDREALTAHRARGLSPDHPVLRGSAQNPDVFFQAREAANSIYDMVPFLVQDTMDRLAARTGRPYHLVDYEGAPDADRVIVMMGSGTGAAAEAVAALRARGERVGLLTVRLFRPFPTADTVKAIPESVRAVSVLDRTKEPGATGEPLYQDVVTALAEAGRRVKVTGGRYGLGSKEFTPAMAAAVFDSLAGEAPKNHFTVGIVDDVTRTSLRWDPAFRTDHAIGRAIFYGLGSDGTVGATKATVKIVADETGHHAQGYFVYDSKKSGSITISHLRFSPQPIRSTYLIDQADFVACHHFGLLDRVDVLGVAAPGATVLLNCPYPPEKVWEHLPARVQRAIQDKGLRVFVVDAVTIARETDLGPHVNTVMQPCFFALTGIVPLPKALSAIGEAIRKSYGKRGGTVVERNLAAVERAVASLRAVEVPSTPVTMTIEPDHYIGAPDFVRRVTARLLAGEGDLLPVSALPIDGTFPVGTAKWEKRSLAEELPVWDPALCIDCGRCAVVCPHAAIRMKVFQPGVANGHLADLLHKPFRSHEAPGLGLTIQIAPDDCTGCGVCVDVCPAVSKDTPGHKALDMAPVGERRPVERARWDAFLALTAAPSDLLPPDTVKGSQVREPLFEFSGACAGCGETPYLKLLTQLFGDRAIVANATGCSSIFGGNLPTTPWTTDAAGRGPAWANSLFEDNAEFGLGIRLACDRLTVRARTLLERLAPQVGEALAADLVAPCAEDDAAVARQRLLVGELSARLARIPGDDAAELARLADELVPRSVWIVGGDGWAYDIGSGGLDHVLASGRNVNVLVLDTEVYSNTGGQASKATPRGAVAKFAAGGKTTPKKDLGAAAMAYGNVYVASVAIGANDLHTVRTFLEAESWPGPSLIVAYATSIAHGIDMATSMTHQKDAVKSGYWPLYRYDPRHDPHPFHLDSKDPTISVRDFERSEGRFTLLAQAAPEEFEHAASETEVEIHDRRRVQRQLEDVDRIAPHLPEHQQ